MAPRSPEESAGGGQAELRGYLQGHDNRCPRPTLLVGATWEVAVHWRGGSKNPGATWTLGGGDSVQIFAGTFS